ncbi:zincin-like metallopeptidase domain-containing protein [uncultured Bradyrhizobium sp.]|uniref:ArdC family protein n=1 Tax=uncultured Bradyrhizobium sp. TaxID=199684 RepID=UPI00262E5829|nr:zincin-like metallopeptidase domain-containing protein [uncultured Bradyrhizobium sp.]
MTRSHPVSARADVYSRITSEIVAAIEAGTADWRMPWHHDGAATSRPHNVSSRKRYRGVNVLALWIAAEASGYCSGLWGTYRQWAALGAQVRKGEHGTKVVFWRQAALQADDDHDDGEAKRGRMFARTFTVFNLAQVEGYEPDPTATLPERERIAHAEAFVAALSIPVTEGAYDAHYRIDLDHIFMPNFSAFRDVSAQLGTLLHECGHATGAKHRLDRNFAERFKRDSLAIEEICAELTASFVLADLGIAHHPRADHAAYVASWLRVLKDDPRAIFTAASKAQAAAEWMHDQQPQTQELAA